MPPALDLARRYAEALAALRAVHDFDAWLGDHWHEHCPPPASAPDAQTALGAAGAITWYETAEFTVGFLPGRDGCFRITRESQMPEFPLTDDDAPAPYGNDIVISAAMQEEARSPDR